MVRKDLERAYQEGRGAFDASDHCLSCELAQGVEEPEHWILRIEWDSLEGYEQGFRRSAEFGAFLRAVKPFFEQIEEMQRGLEWGTRLAVENSQPAARPVEQASVPRSGSGEVPPTECEW